MTQPTPGSMVVDEARTLLALLKAEISPIHLRVVADAFTQVYLSGYSAGSKEATEMCSKALDEVIAKHFPPTEPSAP